MENTGERYLPEYDGDWTLEHVHRYLVACEFAGGKDVLDIACGEGYGSAMLASVAGHVTGVDIDAEAVDSAALKYQMGNLVFRQGNVTSIPMADESVDIVVCFETVEHVAEQDTMMLEVRRVLRPGGLLFISSPDKREYSDLPDFHNEFHVRELYRDEFEALLRRHFTRFQVAGQRVLFGSVMGTEIQEGNFFTWDKDEGKQKTRGLSHAEYLVAVAGDGNLPSLPCGIFRTSLERSNRVRWLKEHLDGAWLRIEDLERRLKEAEDAISFLEPRYREGEIAAQKLHEAEDKIRRMERSCSWRMTKPLRSIRRGLKKLKAGWNRPKAPSSVQAPHSSSWAPDVRALRMELPFSRTEPVQPPPKLGVFLHMFYPELTDEVLACLNNLPPADIHISTDTEEKQSELYGRFQAAGYDANIRICPNKGWDIAPFLVGFGDIISEYPLILRMHSKRSVHMAEQRGEQWRAMLYASLAGSPERVNAVLHAFEEEPLLGMVCPPIYPYYANAVHFGGNYAQMRDILEGFDIHVTPDTVIDFPMGSMFWCRPQVLKPWLEKKFTYEDFAPLAEDVRDSSLAHSMERLFFFGCGIAGYRWARLPD